jgi:hypothetical protein
VKQCNKNIPEWKAPESLLTNIMSAIESVEKPSGFFAWPLFYRFLFGAGAVVAGIILLTTGVNGVNAPDVFIYMDSIIRHATALCLVLMTISSVFFTIVNSLMEQPMVMVVIVSMCFAIFLAWTGSVAALYRMLHIPQRR